MPSKREASRRHAQHYLDVLRAANNYYEQGGINIQTALSRLDDNWGQIQQGQLWVAASAEEDENAAMMCSLFPVVGAELLVLRQDVNGRIRWLEAALPIARHLGQKKTESSCLGNLGVAYSDQGQNEAAIDYHKQALEILQTLGDKQGESAQLGNLGTACESLGQYQQAAEYHQRALVIAREIGDKRGQGIHLNNLGNIYIHLGEYSHAMEHLQEAITLARESGDRRGESNRLGNLGSIYLWTRQLAC
jgi:tetratricopeptide (TPR) repeat protein